MARGYVRETLHFDRPVSPLFSTLVVPAIERGLRRAWGAQGGATGELEMRVFDGYVYTGWTPLDAPSPSGPEAQPELGDLAKTWEAEVIPRIHAMQAAVEAWVVPTSQPGKVAAELERIEANLAAQYETLYTVTGVMNAATQMFEGMLAHFGDPSPSMTVALLLSPADSLLRDIDIWVARLATLVAQDPELVLLLDAPPALIARLLQDEGAAGKHLRTRWSLCAARPTGVDIAAATWAEDPAPLVRLLVRGASAEQELAARTKAAMARRDEAEARTLARMPPAAADSLAPVLAMLRAARGSAQTINHLVGERALGIARLAFLRAGAHLVAAGVLVRADDITFLERDEVLGALRGDFPRAGLVAKRRAALERAMQTTPPATLGEPPAGLDDDPKLAALLGFSGGGDPPAVGAAMRGMGASPGRARGPVRRLRDDADLDAVREGEVLVVVSLAPHWTPAMLRASAIVAQTGGMLCHAAIVAREMAKPAVVGVSNLLERVADGDVVEVDGEEGTVKVQ